MIEERILIFEKVTVQLKATLSKNDMITQFSLLQSYQQERKEPVTLHVKIKDR